MTTAIIDLPDGRRARVEFDSEEQLDSVIADLTAPRKADSLRQAALTGRNLAEGVANVFTFVPDAVMGATNVGIRGVNALLGTDIPQGQPYSETFRDVLTRYGAPVEETEGERAAGKVTRSIAGAATGLGVGRAIAGPFGNWLATNPRQQMIASVAAPAAGEIARQAGAPPAVQFGAEMLGAMAVPGDAALRRVAQEKTVRAGADALLRESGAAATGRAAADNPATRAAGALLDTGTKRGQELVVGRILNDAASDPRLARASLSKTREIVPGSMPTVGNASRDVGLARLENTVNKQPPGRVIGEARVGADVARNQAMDAAGIVPEIPGKIRERRDMLGDRARDAALRTNRAADLKPIYDEINRIAVSPAGARPEVQQALEGIYGILDDAVQNVNGKPYLDAKSLYEVRKSIGALIEGRLKGYANREGREIINASTMAQARGEARDVMSVLTQQLERAAPGMKPYLEQYARMSRVADTFERMAELRGRATTMDGTIAEGMFVRGLRNEIDVIRKTAPKGMGSHVKLLERVAEDIERGAFANSGKVRVAGSDTAQALNQSASIAYLIGRVKGTGPQAAGPAAERLLKILKPIDWLLRLPDDEIMALLAETMTQPGKAALLMRKADGKSIEDLSRALRDTQTKIGLANVAAQQTTIQKD